MKAGKKALSTTMGAIILFAAVAGFIALFALENYPCRGLCGGTNVQLMELNTSSYNATTNTLNLTLHNPTSQATNISSVTVNDTSCSTNFQPIKGDSIVTVLCNPQNSNFTKGEALYFVIDFTNGESITSYVVAQ